MLASTAHHVVVRHVDDVIVNIFPAVAAIVRVTPMLPGGDPCPPDDTPQGKFPKALTSKKLPAGRANF